MTEEIEEFKENFISFTDGEDFEDQLDRLYHKTDIVPVYYITERGDGGYFVLKTQFTEKIEKETGDSIFIPYNDKHLTGDGYKVISVQKNYLEKQNKDDRFNDVIEEKENYHILSEGDTIIAPEDCSVKISKSF